MSSAQPLRWANGRQSFLGPTGGCAVGEDVPTALRCRGAEPVPTDAAVPMAIWAVLMPDSADGEVPTATATVQTATNRRHLDCLVY
jgi:hypothetical protein